MTHRHLSNILTICVWTLLAQFLFNTKRHWLSTFVLFTPLLIRLAGLLRGTYRLWHGLICQEIDHWLWNGSLWIVKKVCIKCASTVARARLCYNVDTVELFDPNRRALCGRFDGIEVGVDKRPAGYDAPFSIASAVTVFWCKKSALNLKKKAFCVSVKKTFFFWKACCLYRFLNLRTCIPPN